MRAILDRAVDGIVTIDEQGRIESFNRSAERMFGYTASEVLGVEIGRLIAFVPVADNDHRWPPTLPEAEHSIQGVQVEGRRKDGSEVPLEVSLSAVVVGERRLVTALLRDISERRRQERRTAAQQAVTKILSQAKTIEEAASALIAALGTHLGWQVANIWLEAPDGAQLHRAAAWRSDAARFEATIRVTDGVRLSRGQGIPGRVWQSGESLWTESFADVCTSKRAEAAREDGLYTALACPIVVNDSVLGVIEILSTKAIVRDEVLVDVIKAFGSQLGQFIERKEAEDALRVAKEAAEQASRAKTDFLANVSHEIRTPLNAILGVADILWESELDDEQRQYMSLFRRAGANLLVLVNDLLDLSKVEAGQLELKKVAFDPREVVAQALESTSVGAYEKGLEVVGRVSLRVPSSVFGDPARLRQVLVNLLSNAVKFTSRGEVLLDVERDPRSADGGALMFSVRDTGIGIPQDKLDAIFDRFSQVDASLTRVHGGTGLGLAICRRLVDLMGGRIWAESELGAGTTFFFTTKLEVAPENATAPAWTPAPSSLRAERKRVRVLVIEDHAATRGFLAEVLQDSGFFVTEMSSASSGRVAIESAERQMQPFDAVIVDAKIKNSDGFDLVDWLQKVPNRARSTILLLPADAKANEMSAVREQGFACYILKPALQNRVSAAVALVSRTSVRTPSISPSPEPPVSQVRSLDILLVEDHPDNRLIVQSYLKRTPHRLTIAENGEAAVAAFKKGSFHVVLMDMQMPVMDGYEATRRIRAWEREQGRRPTPILALTAHALNEEVERTKLAGCDAHLGKPIVKATLLAALEEHAAPSSREDEALLATIDPDLLDLVPGYIQNRFRDVALCRDHLAQGRFEEIRVIAHGMAGSGGAYGFDEITRIGRSLQVAARGQDARTCAHSLDELEAYVRRIHAAYGH